MVFELSTSSSTTTGWAAGLFISLVKRTKLTGTNGDRFKKADILMPDSGIWMISLSLLNQHILPPGD